MRHRFSLSPPTAAAVDHNVTRQGSKKSTVTSHNLRGAAGSYRLLTFDRRCRRCLLQLTDVITRTYRARQLTLLSK